MLERHLLRKSANELWQNNVTWDFLWINIYVNCVFLLKEVPLRVCVIAVFDKFIAELNQKDSRLFITDKSESRGNVSCQLVLKCGEI